MLQIGCRLDLRSLGLGHFLAIDGEEPMDVYKLRKGKAGGLKNTGPKQRMKVRDVFADEVVDLGLVALPPIGERFVILFAPLPSGSDVTDRRIKPNIPIVAWAIWNLKTKIRCRPRYVPVTQRIAEEMSLEIVCDFRLQMFARLCPTLQEFMQRFKSHEQMLGRLLDGGCATECARRIDQIGRRVGSTALAAVVAVLIDCFARRASSLDKTIGQERASDWIE